MTGGKPIAVLLQSISGVSAINPSRLLRHLWRKERGRGRGLFFYFVPGTTRDSINILYASRNVK
jgi:hypothetical protein